MALSIIGLKAARVIAHNQTTQRIAACLLIPRRIAAIYKSVWICQVAFTWQSTYARRIVPVHGDVRCSVAHRTHLRQRHRGYAIVRRIDLRPIPVDKKCHRPGFGTERHAIAGIPGQTPMHISIFTVFCAYSAALFRASACYVREAKAISLPKWSAQIIFRNNAF